MAMLNITSLPKHIDEICVLLATKNFDILALNETRLDHSIPDDLEFDVSSEGCPSES